MNITSYFFTKSPPSNLHAHQYYARVTVAEFEQKSRPRVVEKSMPGFVATRERDILGTTYVCA